MNILIGERTKRKIRLKTTAFVAFAIIFTLAAYKTYIKVKRKLRAMDIDGKILVIILITNE